MSRAKTIVTFAVIVIVGVITWVVRLRNPAMTETQLMLSFWWLWLISVSAIFITLVWMRKTS